MVIKKLKTVIFRVFIFDPVDSSSTTFFRGFVDTSTTDLKNHWVGSSENVWYFPAVFFLPFKIEEFPDSLWCHQTWRKLETPKPPYLQWMSHRMSSYIFLWSSHGKNKELPNHLWCHQFAELVRTSMRSSVSCHLYGYDSVNWRPCRRPDLFSRKENQPAMDCFWQTPQKNVLYNILISMYIYINICIDMCVHRKKHIYIYGITWICIIE